MRRIVIMIVLLSNIFMSGLRAGGPWVQSKKSTYGQIGYNYISPTNKLFSKGEDFLLLPYELSDHTISLYLEHGLTNKFSLMAYVPFKIVQTQGDYLNDNSFKNIEKSNIQTGRVRAFGNIEIFGNYQLYNKNSWVLSAMLGFSIPSGKDNAISHIKSGFDTWGVVPKVAVGYSQNKYYGYLTSGYNYRNGLTNEYNLGMELGYKIIKSVYVILGIDVIQSIRDLDPIDPSFYFVYSDQQEYFAATAKLSIPVKSNVGINLHMTLKTYMANYVQKGPAIGGSIYWKF